MVDKAYIPKQGNIIWLQFNPQTGHEQAGRRPALVLSPSEYNNKTGLAIVCPITSKIKGYPFEVHLPADSKVMGAILADQVKNLDWRARKAEFICEVPNDLLETVRSKLELILF